MKKALILILLFLLSACGSKNASWEDVKPQYEEAYNEMIKKAGEADDFLRDDFIDLIAKIREETQALSSPVTKDDEENALSLYKDAILLGQLGSQSNSLQSAQLGAFSEKIQSLIELAFNKNDSFKEFKAQILEETEQILSWSDDDWKLVERRKKITWNEVEDFYLAMEERLDEEFIPGNELSEYDLESYKDIILNQYPDLVEGVDELNRHNADGMYEAAYSLAHYTEDLEGEDAQKVYRFATQAMEYVKGAYGEKIDDPDYCFPDLAKDAEKWTLSLWNELIKLLNM